jgi:hypothetical protein
MAFGISQLENRDWTFKNNVTIDGDFTVEGDFTFGDASTDSLLITGTFAQTSDAVTDGHVVGGAGNLTAGNDLARFSSTGSISSTSNVLSVVQSVGAGAVGAYALHVGATGANVEAIKVDAGNCVFDEDLDVTGTITGGTVTDGTFTSTAGTATGGVSITSTTFTDGTATLTAGGLSGVTTIGMTGDLTCNGGDASIIETADGAVGAELNLQQKSASPAASDEVGIVNFIGDDDGAGDTTYAKLSGSILDATAGAEFGSIIVEVQNGTGSLVPAASVSHNGVAGALTTGVIINQANVGVAGTNVTAAEFGDGYNHTTILTLTGADLGEIGGGGNLAIGALIYTFPVGAHVHTVTSANVALAGDAAVQADTPDVGIGSVIGTGAVAVLGGTATFEDYINGSAAADVNGTPTINDMTINTAGTIMAGISFNAVSDTKTLHYNAAFNWSGASASILATGVVIIQWQYHS